MRLKRYLQFIKESVNDNSMYWIDEDQIKDIFQNITDEGYVLNITKVFFGHYGITSGYSSSKFYDPNKNSEDDKLILFDANDDDVVLSGQSYNPGWRISIVKGQYPGDDVTDEFQSAISQLKGEGYIIDTVEDEEGKTNLENIHLKKGVVKILLDIIDGKTFQEIKKITFYDFRQITARLPTERQKTLQIVLNKAHELANNTGETQ